MTEPSGSKTSCDEAIRSHRRVSVVSASDDAIGSNGGGHPATDEMTAADFGRWMSLYAATGVCCAIATALAVVRVAVQMHRERFWVTTHGWRAWLMLAPLVWWRWQKTYLLSTPVTLAIVGAFALSLDWGR